MIGSLFIPTTGYFLNSKQIVWMKNNIRRFPEKVTFDVGAILVSDNQGVAMRQIAMYIMEGDGISFIGDIARYDITPSGGEWQDEGPLAQPSASLMNGAMLRQEVKVKVLNRLSPTTLHDGDGKFEELKRLISRC